ncbi:MAG: hypothetical protein DDG60_14450 [Anaerolineae bacterium]|nr:MAG: hypothetical protein DDG60_14450 [Anaerolineae bacterium]
MWITYPYVVIAQGTSPTPSAVPLTPSTSEVTPSLTAIPSGITAPIEGATLSGLVTISGSASAAWQLAFAYRDDPTGTWFPLATSSAPFTGDLLPAWDTTRITDGLYTLRLRIFTTDSFQDYYVTIRIRNYSPSETPTPAGTPTPSPTASATPLPSATPTITYTPAPPPTALPTNPAQLPVSEIGRSFGQGALVVIALFTFCGLLLALSQKLGG